MDIEIRLEGGTPEDLEPAAAMAEPAEFLFPNMFAEET